MAGLDDLLGAIPIGDIAKRLGIDEATARNAVSRAVPALVGGLQKNVENGGAASLDKALDKHAAKPDPSTIDDVDEEDGNKIVANVFGGKQQDVAAALGSTGGGVDLGGIIGKVLPLVAPIVLSKLGNQKAATQSGGGGFDIGGLLGGFLGGGSGAGGAGGGGKGGGGLDVGGVLGSLGGLLGGGKK
ncbi:DUF937 domain-containing protein [Curtobacterium sp. SORGH_AS_0776]|uniref:DUF937 domain-containing protein n=1 Tax=Curtobacterium sp. SORGH_AS_0776 TaxID=3041798 RepID=UPI00286737DE|nr:DUF937 domain-containing protein [Curtobacterium sp. SORGH_AS_0776]MDR6169038.1 hypothetical protein [Curtobacterium sp. SORGH_AS_0776]